MGNAGKGQHLRAAPCMPASGFYYEGDLSPIDSDRRSHYKLKVGWFDHEHLSIDQELLLRLVAELKNDTVKQKATQLIFCETEVNWGLYIGEDTDGYWLKLNQQFGRWRNDDVVIEYTVICRYFEIWSPWDIQVKDTQVVAWTSQSNPWLSRKLAIDGPGDCRCSPLWIHHEAREQGRMLQC